MNPPISSKRAPNLPSEGLGEGQAPPQARAARRGRDAPDGPFPALFAGRRRWSFLRLVAAGVAQGASLAGVALLMRAALDRAFSSPPSDTAAGSAAGAVWPLIAGLVGCAVAAGLLKWFAHIEAERVGQSYAHALRMRLVRKLAGSGERLRVGRGAVLLRLSGDLTPLRQWVSRGIAQLIVSSLTIAVALAALAAINWTVAAAVAVTLAAAAAAALALSRGLGAKTVEARRRRGQLTNSVDSALSPADAAADGPPSRQSNRRGRSQMRRQSRKVRDALLERANYAGAMRAIAESAGAVAGVAAMAAGVTAAASGGATPGAVMSAVFVAGVLGPHVHASSRALEYWTGARVARQKQQQLFDRLSNQAPSNIAGDLADDA